MALTCVRAIFYKPSPWARPHFFIIPQSVIFFTFIRLKTFVVGNSFLQSAAADVIIIAINYFQSKTPTGNNITQSFWRRTQISPSHILFSRNKSIGLFLININY